MEWVTSARLAVETNRFFATIRPGTGTDPNIWSGSVGALFAFNADGSAAKSLVTPRDVARTELNRSAFVPDPNAGEFHVYNPDEVPPDPSVNADGSAFADYSPTPPVQPPVMTTKQRGFRVLDFVAGDPDSILLRTDDDSLFDLYNLNVVTGKLRHESEQILAGGLRPLLDRQGRPGIAVSESTLVAWPHQFFYQERTGLHPWKPLDGLVGTGAGSRFGVSPANFFGVREVPVAFDENPEVLYYASNVGRDTYGLYGLDLRTGKRIGFSVENPRLDLFMPEASGYGNSPFVFDRYTRKLAGVRIEEGLGTTRWIRPEWQAIQQSLERSLPGRCVEILEWDKSGNRFLVLAQGPADSGSFYVFDRTENRLEDFAQRNPSVDREKVLSVRDFACPNPAGGTISGRLTLPRTYRMLPIPVAVLCAEEPWQRLGPDFTPEVDALADFGMAVVQVDARGAWGYGVKYREAIKAGYERAQVEDILAAIDYLSRRFIVDPDRVALVGPRYGGFVALRALQLYPDRFRCAIAIDSAVDPQSAIAEERWADRSTALALVRSYLGSDETLRAAPLVHHPEWIRKPVLLLNYPGEPGQPKNTPYLDAANLARALRGRDVPAELVDLDDDYMHGLPKARAAVFQRIEYFLNLNVYDYGVKMGAPKPLDAKS